MSTTTTSTLAAPVQQSFAMKLLAVRVPNMIHTVPAMYDRMPRNGGTTIRYRRYNPLPVALAPLGNSGITPPAVNLTAIDIDARISFYGQYIYLNEQVTLQNQDPVLNEGAKRLAVSMRQTEDELTRNMLASTASFINCVSGINGDNPTEITEPDISDVTAALLGNDASTILNNIEGENRFGTSPVRNAFFGLCSTDLTKDLVATEGFVQVNQYPSTYRALDTEWGSNGNVRFLISSIGSVTPNASANGNDVYNVFIAGMESYAVIYQDGYSMTFVYRPPIYSDPLAQNASIGWKMAQVPRLLNDQWLFNLRCTLSAPI